MGDGGKNTSNQAWKSSAEAWRSCLPPVKSPASGQSPASWSFWRSSQPSNASSCWPAGAFELIFASSDSGMASGDGYPFSQPLAAAFRLGLFRPLGAFGWLCQAKTSIEAA